MKTHWTVKSNIAANQRYNSFLAVRTELNLMRNKPIDPYVIFLVRFERSLILDCDNLLRALKHIRDGVCLGLGVDDREQIGKIGFVYSQVQSKKHGCLICVTSGILQEKIKVVPFGELPKEIVRDDDNPRKKHRNIQENR